MSWFKRVKYFFMPADRILAEQVDDIPSKTLGIYGAGELGQAVVALLQQRGIKPDYWYDGQIKEGTHSLMQIAVYAPQQLAVHQPERLIVASEAYAEEISKNCRQLGYQGNLICLHK
ncbi:hypothetical protein [Bowmanella sp. JS7-9]|uniref:Uncharacterized protein n=1 Tax=Pseudobowmanella zhangzhouensis TaxID=1537679 RepID=A0ABW1XJ09_9ALTE|nr:hypothetical protein [Bowmanella sp. JS7-9]TBX25874.1 hypothetical protein TK45_04160 [Bowmanella sp. JS7-9]